ncbi:MAG: hypothetical protein ACRED1_01505 [Limisphaerales bacterium]
MKIVTVDDYNRVRLPDVKPRQKFSVEAGNNRIVLALVDEVDVPVVRARKVNGEWIGADVRIDRKAIIDAIREDRESR